MIREYYLLRAPSEWEVCSCACAKIREIETSFIACFLYDLPIFFMYLTNDNPSKSFDLAGGVRAVAIKYTKVIDHWQRKWTEPGGKHQE